jgi:hypothetical protein
MTTLAYAKEGLRISHKAEHSNEDDEPAVGSLKLAPHFNQTGRA